MILISLNIIPDFKIYLAVTNKGSTFVDVKTCRDAFDAAVELKTSCKGCEIILPKLIKDKVHKNLEPHRQAKFYSMVKDDNSTSQKSGLDFSTCLAQTAQSNSYVSDLTLIVTSEKVPEFESIKDNKKIVINHPKEFIKNYKQAVEYFNEFADIIKDDGIIKITLLEVFKWIIIKDRK